MKRAPTHVVMRYSNNLTDVKDTIAAHNDIILEHGVVWMGKMGKTLGHRHIAEINDQCTKDIPSYLYLVQKTKSGYEIFRGVITEVKRGLPERSLVPRYYFSRDLFKFISLWIKLSRLEKVEGQELSDLIVRSSGMPLRETLAKSMAAIFVVKNRKDD